MSPQQLKRYMVAAGIAVIMLVAVVYRWSADDTTPPDDGSKVVVVQSGGTPAIAPAPKLDNNRDEPAVVTTAAIPTDVERKIISAIGGSGVTLKDVTLSDPDGKIACGQRATSVSTMRRFVWLADAGLVATDDGSADFEQFSKLCRNGTR